MTHFMAAAALPRTRRLRKRRETPRCGRGAGPQRPGCNQQAGCGETRFKFPWPFRGAVAGGWRRPRFREQPQRRCEGRGAGQDGERRPGPGALSTMGFSPQRGPPHGAGGPSASFLRPPPGRPGSAARRAGGPRWGRVRFLSAAAQTAGCRRAGVDGGRAGGAGGGEAPRRPR